MRAEILCIGTELIIGQTVNTNATWLSKRLNALGIDVLAHVAVGDNPGRIDSALQAARGRSELIVVTGGLGPTDDDLTHEAIAAHFDLPLIEDPEAMRSVEDAMARWGRPLSEAQRKQALIPEGAEALVNPAGSAPGIWLEQDGTIVVTMPGVPREMEAMWRSCIEPVLARRGEGAIVSHLLKFVGIPESEAAAAVKDLLAQPNPSVAPYVGNAEVHLRLTAKATTRAAAEALLVPLQAEILQRLGKYHFGQDDETLESLVVQALITRGETVATAESVTGGWLAQRLTAVAGASQAFHFGAVTYTTAAKASSLGIDPDVIAECGAVSEPVAQAMAEGVRRVARTDWGIGITGLAGPTGDDRGTPVGRVVVAVVGPGFAKVDQRDFGTTGRETVRWLATQVALRRLQLALHPRR